MMGGGFVYGIEHIDELVELAKKNVQKSNGDLYDNGNVIFAKGDGKLGLPDSGPFDVIYVEVGFERVPRKLLKQLAVGGRLIVPYGKVGDQ